MVGSPAIELILQVTWAEDVRPKTTTVAEPVLGHGLLEHPFSRNPGPADSEDGADHVGSPWPGSGAALGSRVLC